jgi:CubicO group peptidase (beta-lactamase class C family)
MLVGIAIQEGFIQNVDQKMVDLFPEHTIANMDIRKGNITLEHLLTMSEGMDWHELDYPYTDPRNSLGQMWISSDAVQHILDQPMAREPGESWAYNSGTSILLPEFSKGQPDRTCSTLPGSTFLIPLALETYAGTRPVGITITPMAGCI